jgi:hypothetical protein
MREGSLPRQSWLPPCRHKSTPQAFASQTKPLLRPLPTRIPSNQSPTFCNRMTHASPPRSVWAVSRARGSATGTKHLLSLSWSSRLRNLHRLPTLQPKRRRKRRREVCIALRPFATVADRCAGGDTESSHSHAQQPAEASTLPVSDKPVTLSFSKGPGVGKPLVAVGGPTKALAPVALGFSSAEDHVEGSGTGDDQAQEAEDIKGKLLCSSSSRRVVTHYRGSK